MSIASRLRFLRGRKTNAVLKKIDEMKHHPVFRRARFDIFIPRHAPEKVIVLLGQAHTVWRGKIANRERRIIVGCQARLCSYYAYFEQAEGVRSFGGEGIYDGLSTSFHDQVSFEQYRQLGKKMQVQQVALEELPAVAQRFFEDLGKQWQYELRQRSNLSRIQTLAAAVSGQTLYNYLRGGKIETYPVEGERAYQRVLEGISRLGYQIKRLEQTEEMKAIRSRNGLIKEPKELEIIQQRNALIQEFNRVIGSDIRERATLEILREKIQNEPLVVFTMGVGHRKNYLQLAREYFEESQTAFVFITPPELLINIWLKIGIPLLILLSVALLNMLF